MLLRVAISFILFFYVVPNVAASKSGSAEDKICGKWITKEKNLIIQIYKQANNFKTKIVWFKNDKSDKDINEYLDTKNPNPALRNRKIVGMDIVEGLQYNQKSNSWENGTIYDAHHGRFWDTSALITPEGELKVTGYWKFKWIGKTLIFNRL